SAIEGFAALSGYQEGLWPALLGPLLPALTRFSCAALGHTEFGFRFLAPWLIFGASWLLWRLGRGLFDASTASWGVLCFNVLPAVNLAAVTFTPTTLGITLSAALLSALRLALHRSHRWHLPWWSVAAVLCLSFLSDWRMLALAVAAASALAITARGQRAVL